MVVSSAGCLGSPPLRVMLSEKELKEADGLAEEIASLASNISNDSYFEDQVTLDQTAQGWVSNIEVQGRVEHAGKPTKKGWREAMQELKNNILEEIKKKE